MKLSCVGKQPLSWYALRLLAALFPLLTITALFAGAVFTEKAFYTNLSFTFLLCVWALIFAALCKVRGNAFVYCLMVGAAVCYCCVCAAEAQDWAFGIACCAAMLALVLFFEPPRFPEPGKRTLWAAVIALILLYTLYVGGLCCVQYRRYRTPCYDFGLFAQMFYYMKETGRCLVTCERDRLLSHFAVHFSPIYYLFLPVYVLLPSPETLLVLQPLTVAGAAVPLALLCRQKGLSNAAALGFCVCLLMYPAFMGGCFWYLHENCFLTPLLLWLILFFEKGKTLPAFVFALLTLCVKEDAAVYVAAVALYYLFASKNYKCSVSVLLFSVAWFVAVTHLMGAFGLGIMDRSRYGNYMYDGGGLFSVVRSVFMNPAYALKEIFAGEKYLFALQMLAPMCFLPLAIKKPARLVLLIPLILVNLMTRYVYQYNIGYQYTFGSGALLFCMALSNYAEQKRNRNRLLLCAVLSCAILFCGGYAAKADAPLLYRREQTQISSIETALSLIPADADVSASSFLLANLSQRRTVYELESTKQKAQYVAVDLRFNKENSVEPFIAEGYRVLYHDEGVIAILQRDAPNESG
ncbi:MAG: DUF2079 domain-containing protein [Clostridia bacterium]|nr:DUF2079 domain-containing protein [Clostridia bacterium]